MKPKIKTKKAERNFKDNLNGKKLIVKKKKSRNKI